MLRLIFKILWVFNNLFIRSGFYKSIILNKSVDNNNKPIPWYTYSAIRYLEQFDFKNVKIFEIGGGNSTLFYLRKGAKLTVIEDNFIWLKLKKKITYYFCKNKFEYIKAVKKINDHKIIVIDGSYRETCCNIIINKILKKKLIHL